MVPHRQGDGRGVGFLARSWVGCWKRAYAVPYQWNPSMLNCDGLRRGLLLVPVLLTLLGVRANADSKAKQCHRACRDLIVACAARNLDLGNFRHACRTVVLKQCRRAGPAACRATTTSTTMPPPRFMDKGDGTVTDHQTGLIWEKKVAGSSCLHCVNDLYTWTSSGTAPDGTAFTAFLDALNGGPTGVGNCLSDDAVTVTGGFNGHCDWRLPSIVELETIVDLSVPGCDPGVFPSGIATCIDPIFGPTQTGNYWSSTAVPGFPVAWLASFRRGPGIHDVPGGGQGAKASPNLVRAVRGGS
jgi:hypothetical protein